MAQKEEKKEYIVYVIVYDVNDEVVKDFSTVSFFKANESALACEFVKNSKESLQKLGLRFTIEYIVSINCK